MQVPVTALGKGLRVEWVDFYGDLTMHACIVDDAGKRLGKVTSGGFGPSVGGPIAMGYVDSAHAMEGAALQLLVRAAPRPAHVARLPFFPTRYYRG